MRERKRTIILLSIMMIILLAFSSISETIMSTSNSSADTCEFSSLMVESSPAGQSLASTSRRLESGQGRNHILYLSNLTTPRSVAQRISGLVDPNTIRSVVSHIASFDSRYTGTAGGSAAISYISEFLRLNCSIQDVFLQDFTFDDRGVLIVASNIIAKISATQLCDKTIIVTAHHDSIGYQYPINVYSSGARGSDDDASGVGALLETARLLSIFRNYLRYNVLFIVFAAEEGNRTIDPVFMRQGSTQWISGDHPGVDELGDIIGAVNLDEVAYEDGGSIGIFHHTSGLSVASNISSAAAMLSIAAKDELGPRHDSYLKPVRCRTEDTFDGVHIPSVTLSSHYANPFAHTSFDTLSRLDFSFAGNFTKIVVSYVYLTGGILPNPQATYVTSWNSVINPNGRYQLDESNYIDICFNPELVDSYDLVILDPSLNGITMNHLSSIISVCERQGKRRPILSIGSSCRGLFGALNLTELECVSQGSSPSDLVAYVGSSITDVSSHPVFSSPNNVSLSLENSTHLSYTVVRKRSSDNSYHLISNSTKACRQLLPLSFTLFQSKLSSWLATLHDDRWSCGQIGFIGVDNGSSITSVARNIAENMVSWLLNYSTTISIIRVSDRDPLVGSHIKVTVAVRNPLTWEANSSVSIILSAVSPSGDLILRETHLTDEDGIAQSTEILIKEVGQHEVTVASSMGAAGGVKDTIFRFRSNPRIIVHCVDSPVNVTQGESTAIRLNLTYVPALSEDMILEISGETLSSSSSSLETLKHGYNNITLSVTAKETALAGEHNLTLVAMPNMKDYIACKELVDFLIAPAYELAIVEAPNTMAQLSSAQITVQIKSCRSTPVSLSLRISSYKITLVGEMSVNMLPEETRRISIRVEASSSSPYIWGEGEFKVCLIRNAIVFCESSSKPLYVSVSPINIVLGYVLPAALPAAFFLKQSKKTKARVAASGTIFGGYGFFAAGLMLSQENFMIIPLSMLVIGCYTGTAFMRRVYDPSLPKGYDWLDLSHADKMNADLDAKHSYNVPSASAPYLPESFFIGVKRLRELYSRGKYSEIVPALYILSIDALSDLLATAPNATYPNNNKESVCMMGCSGHRTLTKLMKQLKQRRIPVPFEANLITLEELHRMYVKLSISDRRDLSCSMIKLTAQISVGLMADFIKQSHEGA